jgi:antitoxin component YwqK of YwqJK toxin-antitoxin module
MSKLFTLLLILCAFFSGAQNIELRDDGFYYQYNKLYSGRCRETNDSGRLIANLSIRKGKLNGKNLMYYENGKIKELRHYKNGMKSGSWLSWDDQGNRMASAHYLKDEKNGIWSIWDNKGQLRYHMRYRNGVKTGTWFMFDERGKLVSKKKF